MPNPKYKITNFTKDNVHWLKGMLPVSLGGSQVLTNGYSTYSFINAGTTGYSSISTLDETATAISDFQIGSSTYRTMILRDSSHIFLAQQGNDKLGLVHTIPVSGAIYTSQYQDIISSVNDNIFYANNRYLGVGYYFRLTAGSDATSLVCSTATFTTWGVAASTGHNKIYNITLGQEFTVDTTVTETDITVTAIAGKVPSDGDYCIAFVDDKFELTTDHINTDIQFKGQESPSDWRRQIVKLDDRYFILNGNYIAMLSSDETTMTDDYQQLPLGVQSMCFSVNNDLMLIGAKNKNKNGMLLVYDGFSTYFKSIIYTDSIPVSITPYQAGWIVLFENGEIKYTDGVSYKVMAQIPDSEIAPLITNANYNSMLTYHNRIFITLTIGYQGGVSLRQQSGIHIYDIEKDMWSFCDTLDYYGYNTYAPSCLALVDFYNQGLRIVYGKDSLIGALGTGNSKQEIFLDITLPKKESIKTVDLNFGRKAREYYSNGVNSYATVTVSSGDGRYGLYNINAATEASTKTNVVPGFTPKGTAFVGQEIMILGNEYDDSVNSNEFTYITAINNNGESNESWTVFPELTSDFGQSSQAVRQYGFKLAETKTVTYSTINKDNKFNLKDHYGDKLYLHIIIDGYLDLRGINIY